MLELQNINKAYQANASILSNLSFTLFEGQSVAIMGASGRGKTTLLNLLGLLDQDFDGQYYLYGQDVKQWDDKQLSLHRGMNFGFIFQHFLFVNHLNVLSNIALPLIYQGVEREAANEQAYKLLQQFDLTTLASRYPGSLSGGQQQRITIMRALIHRPKCLLMDEPTSQLDSDTQNSLMSFVLEYQKQENCGLVIVTHDAGIANLCQYQWMMT